MINLRFQGIDALETHFEDVHQHLPWAQAARDFVLKSVGYTDVTFFQDMPHRIQSLRNHPQRGYILAAALDANGRVVAFVYPGDADFIDGAAVWLDDTVINTSLNAQLLDKGLAYPAFYTGIPTIVKQHLAALTATARTAGRGLWPLDALSTDRRAEIRSIDDLTRMVMWPKLFRRLVHYFGAGYRDLTQFDAWLRMDSNRDDTLILPDRELGNLHDVIALDSPYELHLNYAEEDLIIVPRGMGQGLGSQTTPFHRPRPSSRWHQGEQQPANESMTDGDVRIIALMVNPKGMDPGKERVTLMNVSAHGVRLENWALVDRAGGQQPLSGFINAGDVRQLILGADSQVQLSNKGDTVTLVDADGNTVDQVTYSAADAKRAGRTLLFGG